MVCIDWISQKIIIWTLVQTQLFVRFNITKGRLDNVEMKPFPIIAFQKKILENSVKRFGNAFLNCHILPNIGLRNTFG